LSFPVYKKISLNSHQKRLIHSQLDQIDFGERPLVFELGHMIKNQDEALANLESYFEEHSINIFTYPIVVLANIPNYLGKLNILSNIKNLPQFFKIKTKQLNAKENQKLNYVELKQTHMKNMQLNEFQPILDEYTRTHKRIHRLNNENEYLKSLAEKLFI
jgi:hypothetical protein